MQPHRKHLKELIAKHYKETKSSKAKELIDDFEKFEPYFWLVMPAASNIQDLLKDFPYLKKTFKISNLVGAPPSNKFKKKNI